MKLALVSDVHANLEALRATLRDIDRQNVDRIVCLGDIVGYHADPAECVILLRDANALCVAGSHDRAAAGLITTDGFSATATLAADWTSKRLDDNVRDFLARLPLQINLADHLVAVHGALLPKGGCDSTRLNTEARRRTTFDALASHPSKARVCAFGHTHDLGVYELRNGTERLLCSDEVQLRGDAYYLVNPGSVGQPRGTSDRRATYMVFDSDRQIVSIHRMAYDYTLPLTKARKAGLMPVYSGLPRPLRALLKWSTRSLGVYGLTRKLAQSMQRRRRESERMESD